MRPAKSGDRDVEVGDVFVKITEETERNLVLGRGKRRLPEQKLRFGGSRLGGL